MANKYCNLDGTKKIKDEYPKINVGFDKVEIDVNSIITGQDLDPNKDIELLNARGGLPTLGERLNETDSKVNSLEIEIGSTGNTLNTRIDNIIATPTTVSEQEIIDARQGSASLGANIMAFKEDYTKLKGISDGVITQDKISFLKRGLNKCNGDFKQLSILDYGNGTADLIEQANSMTAIFPITGGKTYYISQDGGNRKRLGWHKTKPTIGQRLDYYMGQQLAGALTVTAPLDATYLIYTISSGEWLPNIKLQITEDKSYPFFVGYDFIDASNVIGLNDELNVIKDINKGNLGVLYGTNPILKIDYPSKTITIPPGNRMFYKGKRTVVNNATISFANNINNYPMALYYDSIDSNLKLHYIDLSNQLPLNGVLLAMINPSTPEIYGMDIENCEINGKKFIHAQVTDEISSRIADIDLVSKYYFLDDIKGVYEKPTNIMSVASGETLDLAVSPHTVIYNVYDDLVSKYPNYVTRTLLGNEATGLPIYLYHFTTRNIDNQSNYPHNKLKIAITSAVHGYEQGSAWCLAQFFKDLCDNYATKPQLEFMRWNVDFVVVPVCNPYGFNNNQRTNSNLVDINRNFNANWGASTPNGDVDGYYGGISPNSEIETQLIQSFIDSNVDSEYLIDYHNIAGGYPLFYLYDSEASTIALNTFKTLSRKWSKDYPLAPKDGTLMGYVKTGVNASISKYALSKGIKSFTFETPWKIPFGVSKYDKPTIETGVECFGNTLVTILKSLK